jgi:predicted type IV restriction endonuclease
MTGSATAYDRISILVKKFKNLSAAKRRSINEMATRLGYILPLYSALGGETANNYEVNPEEKVSRGFVNFSFCLSGVPTFN